MLSKVSSTFGLSSASMAARDRAFSYSSSSSSPSTRPSAPATAPTARHGRCQTGGPDRRRHRLSLRPFVGRLQVDDVAQQNLCIHQLVAPNDDGLERQRTFTQTRYHRLAAGLDTLGDRDLALTREQLHRAHVARVHAHGIVRTFRRLSTRPRDRGNGRGDHYCTAAGFVVMGPLTLFVLIHGSLVHV